MLKIQEIREIIKLIDQSDIEQFVYEHEGSKLELKKKSGNVVQSAPVQVVEQPVFEQAVQPVETQHSGAPAPSVAPAQANEQAEPAFAEENLHTITSPMVGTFYQAPSPDSDPYVKVGSVVQSDTIVCIVEAMKLFNEIEAEVDGEIVEILVKDGELVEYGQALFLVKPN